MTGLDQEMRPGLAWLSMPKLDVVERTRVLSDEQLQRLLYALEALRQEMRAATLVQMRSESAIKAVQHTLDNASEYAGKALTRGD